MRLASEACLAGDSSLSREMFSQNQSGGADSTEVALTPTGPGPKL
jgi:hypothetical protein